MSGQQQPKREEPKKAAEPPHLRLWNRLKVTAPGATKSFTRKGGFKGTQINPTWRIQQMTETFGPIGIGWGYEQLDLRILPEASNTNAMVFICVCVWYVDPETKEKAFTGPQWGGTELYSKRRDGAIEPDDEAFKKSITDALGKCFVQIGLAADIHLGLWEDSKYQEEAGEYHAHRNDPELQPAAIEAFEKETQEKIAAITALDALDDLWRDGGYNQRLKAIAMVDAPARQRLTTLFSNRKAELLREQGGEKRADVQDKRAPAKSDATKAPPPPPKASGHLPAEPAPNAIAPKPALPPHDPDTGEIKAPHRIVPTVREGKQDWIKWGKEVIAALKTARTQEEAEAWWNACLLEIEEAREAGLKVYISVAGCFDDLTSRLPKAGQPFASPETAGSILSAG